MFYVYLSDKLLYIDSTLCAQDVSEFFHHLVIAHYCRLHGIQYIIANNFSKTTLRPPSSGLFYFEATSADPALPKQVFAFESPDSDKSMLAETAVLVHDSFFKLYGERVRAFNVSFEFYENIDLGAALVFTNSIEILIDKAAENALPIYCDEDIDKPFDFSFLRDRQQFSICLDVSHPISLLFFDKRLYPFLSRRGCLLVLFASNMKISGNFVALEHEFSKKCNFL